MAPCHPPTVMDDNAAAMEVMALAIRVSVIIPAYNRSASILAAIESVLAQGDRSAEGAQEIIVVDDGSADDLAGALRNFNGRIRLIRHERNRGAAAARNTGVAAASGAYVAFLDSDDVWLPGKLAAQIGFMQAQDHRASCTAYLLKRAHSPPFVSPRYRTGALGLSDLSWGCFVSPGSTLVFRRETFAEIGMLDEGLQRLEDWDWLLRYVRAYPLGFLAQPLARIEVAPGTDVAARFAALARMEEKHAAVLPPRDRRHFKAALQVERAAAYYLSGRPLAAVAAVARSLCLAPVRNRALAAVLHNRLWGRRKPARGGANFRMPAMRSMRPPASRETPPLEDP